MKIPPSLVAFLTLSSLAFSAAAQGLRPININVPAASSTLPWKTPVGIEKDPDALLEQKMKGARPKAKGTLAQFGARTVEVGPNKVKATLQELASAAFIEHESLRSAAKRSRSSLMNVPVTHDYVLEMANSYVLVKRTHVVVTNPQMLARSSKDWSEFMSASATTTARDFKKAVPSQKTNNASRKAIEAAATKFMSEDVPKLPVGHPLKLAAAQGRDALLKAIAEGKGDVVVTDVISVPKAGRGKVADFARVHRPNGDLAIGRINLNDPRSTRVIGPGVIKPIGLRDANLLAAPEYTTMRVASGAFTGRHVQLLADDMPRNNIGFGLQAVSGAPSPDNLDTLRFVQVEGAPFDFRIASTWDGDYVYEGNRGYLHATREAASDGIIFRVLTQDGKKVLVDTESGKFVQIDGNGFLKMGTTNRASATKFTLSASTFQPEVRAYLGRHAANASVSVETTSPNGRVTRQVFRTNANGQLQSALRPARGSMVKLTPSHGDLVFTPSEQTVETTSDRSVVFSATQRVRAGGAKNFREELLAGFTLGHEWDWERRWDYTSGFFRVSIGASIGVGFRVPVEVSGTLSPGSFTSAADAGNQNVTASARVRVFDAPESFYQQAGLARSQRFDGQEIVLEAQAYYGMKFRALWKDWVNVPKQTYGFDLSRDWSPPWQDGTGEHRFVIPPELTHSVIDFGVLRGEATAAIKVSGEDPTVKLNGSSKVDGRSGRSQTLTISPNETERFTYSINPVRNRSFGAEFRPHSDFYGFDVVAVPQVRLSATASVDLWFDEFSRTFRTDWITISKARVNFGRVNLPHHNNTNGTVRVDGQISRVNP